ncbi:MAG: protein kinase [Peptococcaceae bacterium]|nr:protein kinase [Peptococcaceae bacterium]
MTDIKTYEPLWGTWYIESLLGEGGFGKVYKVRREEFGTTYYSAVKIISIPHDEGELRQMKNDGMDDVSMQRYLYAFVTDIISEIALMRQFRGNSHIVSLEDHQIIDKTGDIGWDILIRMELLTGLFDHAEKTPLSKADIVKLGIDICRALELCAKTNTIHRDIKPENIFISPYGEYKLGDFGIARKLERTSSGLSKKGTYTYMAPEVFRGEQYGANVDTYSLGMVLYRLLNHNRVPFMPDFPQPIMPSHRDEALGKRLSGTPLPVLKGVSPELNGVVLRACAFTRQERFVSPTEMRDALETIEKTQNYESAATGIEYSSAMDQTFAVPGQAQSHGTLTPNLSYTPSTPGQNYASMPGQNYASMPGQNYASVPGQNYASVPGQNYAAQTPHPMPSTLPPPNSYPQNTSKNKTKLIAVLASLGALAIVGVVILIFALNNMGKDQTLAEKEEVLPEGQTQTFTSADSVYHIEVPKDWKHHTDDRHDLETISVEMDGDEVYFAVLIFSKEDFDLDLKGFVDLYTDTRKDFCENYFGASAVNYELGGYAAFFTEASFTDTHEQQQEVSFYQFIFETDANYITLFGQCPKNKKDTYEPVIKEIAASFKVVGQEKAYVKGALSETGWESEFFRLKFTAPQGYTMKPMTEWDGPFFTVEMHASGNNWPELTVYTYGLDSISRKTEEKYLEEYKTEYSGGEGVLSVSEITEAIVAGGSHKKITSKRKDSENGEYFQDFVACKIGNRMIVMVFTYTAAQSQEKEALLQAFTKL